VRSFSRRSRGAAALEMALTAPALVMIFVAGFFITRAIMTRVLLGYAVGYASRSAAIGGKFTPADVRPLVLAALGKEIAQCEGGFDVQTRVVPGAFVPQGGAQLYWAHAGEALAVEATCVIPGRFAITTMNVRASATFPF
jgi:hypothetical protein